MNKKQKEVELAKLSDEERELKRLKVIYNKAANDISKKLVLSNGRINLLLAHYDELDDVQKSMLQSQIYQRNFQLSLKKQIDGFMKDLESKQYDSIDSYLKDCYETGFVGTMYDLHGQGIPLIMPIDQKKVAAAIKLDPKISKNLYTKLGEDVAFLKKRIANNISRGIATASEYKVIARNIAADSNVGFNRAMRIARTEGHGVQVQAAVDVQHEAKAKGADIVKQWDAALDGRTRESHRQVDGEIRELDEKFSNNMMYPSDPAGGAAEVVNCRCALLQRAKWALDEEELETLKERAKYFKLDKTENFEDFKKKYLKAAENVASQATTNNAANVSYIENTYGVTHANAVRSTIDNADDDVKAVWNKYQSKFKTSNATYTGNRAFYSPSSDDVTLNIASAAKGNSYQTPYQVLYHEYGHMTDYLIARDYGKGQYFAFTELFDGIDSAGNIIWTSFGSGGLLGKTAKNELKQRLADIKKANGFKKKAEAANFLINEITSNYTLLARSDVSDMLEGAGIGVKYPLGVGHGLNYWKNRDNGKEIFAEIISAEIASPDSLDCIKKYFPETYKVFRDMLKAVK